MRLLQSPHLNDFPQVCVQGTGLTPQRTAPADTTSKDDTPKAKDETADRIIEFLLRASGLRRTPSLSLSTLTSLSLSTQVRQPLVNSLPWTIPGAVPDFIGCKSERIPPAASPICYAGAWPLAGTNPPALHAEPVKTWPMFDRVSPLVMPSTLRELTVHDHGFRCTQFFAILACQLTHLEIKCVTDGFDPIPLFRESARLLHPRLRKGALQELAVCSERDTLVVQCACSAPAYCDSPIADGIVQPALSIALDFSADDGLPPLAIYEDIITASVNALPLGAVCRMLVDFHADFRGAWFAGFFSCLGSLQSITLRRQAFDGFLQTHLWMAYNDPAAAMVPFRSLKTVFAEWDTRWPQVRADADRILRYLNAGGVYLLFCNVGGHAEGFVRGLRTYVKGGSPFRQRPGMDAYVVVWDDPIE